MAGLARAGQDLHQITPTNGRQGWGQLRESVAGFEPLPDALRFTASVEAGAVRRRDVQVIRKPRPVCQQPVTDRDFDLARLLYWLVGVPLAGPHWSRQATSVVFEKASKCLRSQQAQQKRAGTIHGVLAPSTTIRRIKLGFALV